MECRGPGYWTDTYASKGKTYEVKSSWIGSKERLDSEVGINSKIARELEEERPKKKKNK